MRPGPFFVWPTQRHNRARALLAHGQTRISPSKSAAFAKCDREPQIRVLLTLLIHIWRRTRMPLTNQALVNNNNNHSFVALLSSEPTMAMDSQAFMNHSGQIAPPEGTYQEVYHENGRWYGTFKKGKYMFPIDENELERLDVFHKVFSVARRDALHSAPLHDPESPRVLDLGCGTGIWNIAMAGEYPRGTHVGVDLNYIQPEFIPANLRFYQKDIEDKWQDLEPGSWDLIHMRTLNGSISNWPRVYAEVFRHLKPHYGYFEQVEIDWSPRSDDGSLRQNAHIVRWANEVQDAMDSFGRPMRLDSNLTKQRLAEAGFVDIKEEVIQMPLNGWPSDPHAKNVGRWFNLGMNQTYQPLSLAPLCRGHGRTVDEVQDLARKVKREVYSNSVHAYCTLHIFTARKPRYHPGREINSEGRPIVANSMPAHCNFNREAIQINRNMKRAVSSLRAWCQRECPRVIELHHGSSGTCRSRPPPACTLAWHPGLLPSAESGLFWGPGWTWRPAQRRSSLNTPTPSHLRLLGLHCPRRITKSPTRDAEPVVVSVWPGFRWHPVVRWLAVRVGYLEGGEVGICGVFAWLASGWLIRSVTPSGERQSC